MAIQVKFHSVTAENYNAIQSPEAGSLYFITDNGEIRKGASHITGTRVYTAVDATNGLTPVASLEIKFNGNTPGVNDQPKKGDILVVDQTLKAAVEAQGTEGQDGYVPAVPAVIAKAAYVHNGTDWEACDGNVDASKVILTGDIMMAGDYKNVGNKDKGSTTASQNWETSGMSVAEALQEIFTKKLQPTITAPAVTLKINNSASNYSTSVEVGEVANIPNYSATLSAGSYTYGPSTGVSAQSWSVTETKGDTTQTTSSGALPSVRATDGSQSYTVTATATHNAGATPKDNIGGTATVAGIAAGDKAQARTVTVTGYRKWFYKVDTDGTGTIDSAFIRGSVNGGNCETATDKQFTTGEGAVRIVVAVPKKTSGTASIDGAKTLSNVILVSASNTPILEHYKKQESTVNVNDANGENPIPYEIWIYKPASISPTEVHKLVIG